MRRERPIEICAATVLFKLVGLVALVFGLGGMVECCWSVSLHQVPLRDVYLVGQWSLFCIIIGAVILAWRIPYRGGPDE